MRGIGYILALGLTGCMSSGGGGRSDASTQCQVPECGASVKHFTNPDDPAEPTSAVLLGNRTALAAVICVAGKDTIEQGADWSEGVVVDLRSQEVVWHYYRNDDESVDRVECADPEAADVMQRLTPPEDWRFGHLLSDCDAGDTRPCGCVDGRASERVCETTWERGQQPIGWGACVCD